MPTENIIVLIIVVGGAVAFGAVTAWLSSEKVKKAGRG